jgi:hypothetical protein
MHIRKMLSVKEKIIGADQKPRNRDVYLSRAFKKLHTTNFAAINASKVLPYENQNDGAKTMGAEPNMDKGYKEIAITGMMKFP